MRHRYLSCCFRRLQQASHRAGGVAARTWGEGGTVSAEELTAPPFPDQAAIRRKHAALSAMVHQAQVELTHAVDPAVREAHEQVLQRAHGLLQALEERAGSQLQAGQQEGAADPGRIGRPSAALPHWVPPWRRHSWATRPIGSSSSARAWLRPSPLDAGKKRTLR